MADSDFAGRVVEHVEGAFWRKHGAAEFVCPIDNGTAYVQRDGSVDCSTGCDPERLSAALTFLVETLPQRCNESESTRMAFGHMQTCPRCLAYTPAVRSAYQEVRRRFVASPVTSEGGGDLRGTRQYQERIEYLRVDALARRDLAEELADDGSGWDPEELADAPDVPERSVLTVPGVGPLMRRGWVTLVHGVPASGKTPLELLAGVEEVHKGNMIALIDYEVGPAYARALLLELGLTTEQMREAIYYRYSPPPMTDRGWQRLTENIERMQEETGRPWTFVGIDSLTKSMAQVAGADDNNALDTTAWYNSLPNRLRDADLAVLVIDHSVKGDSDKPSGSHKKNEEAQLHIHMRLKTPFSKKHERGEAALIVRKDRAADFEINAEVAVLHTTVGGSFHLDAPTPLAQQTGAMTLSTDLSRGVNPDEASLLDALRQAGTTGALRSVLTGSGGGARRRRAALDRLYGKRLVGTRPEPGTVGVRYWLAEFAPRDAEFLP